jgi:uncharacterized protein YndB with AHSA1/START domain
MWARQYVAMSNASITVDSTAGVESVFQFVADPTNETRWNPDARRSELVTAGPIAPGSQARTVGSMGGRQMVVEVTVEDVDPPRLTTTSATAGPMRFHTTYVVSPTDGGSRVTMTVELSAAGPVRLALPFVRVAFGRRLRRLQPALKAALDQLTRS